MPCVRRISAVCVALGRLAFGALTRVNIRFGPTRADPAAHKASSVQFTHFPFTDAQVAAFRKPGTQVILGFDHPQYGHMVVVPEAVRAALSEDFD